MTKNAHLSRSLSEMSAWIGDSAPIKHPVAIERAIGAFKDTISCMIAGHGDPAPRAVFNAYKSTGAGLCSVVGNSTTLPAENAALVNGTAAHAIEL